MAAEPSAVVAEVPCAPGGRLHISWGLGNELYALDLQQAGSRADSTASCVQWGRLSPGQRRIAYDSLSQYTALQQRDADPRSPEGWAGAAEYWRSVGAVLAADPSRAVDAGGDEALTLQERAVWDLLALFFLEAQQAQQGLAAQDLAGWLRRNAGAVCGGCRAGAHPLPPSLVAELREAALPETHPGYWGCLQRLVCLGWLGEAVELLGLHSAWLRWEGGGGGASGSGAASGTGGGEGDDGGADPATAAQVAALEAATLLLRRMPLLSSSATAVGTAAVGREFTSLPEFMAYRRGWQGECAAVLQNARLWQRCGGGAPETAEGLRAAMGVLSGDEAAVAAAAHGWLELLVGQLLHVYPAIKPQAELKQLVQRCYGSAAAGAGPLGDDFSALLAALLEACCDGDAQTVVRACSAYPCTDWFMAHAPLLLAPHPGGVVLGRELPHLGGDQVEFYTLDYATALMPAAATWQVAAAYLAWCPAHGRPVLEALLSRLPLDAADEATAAKAAALAAAHGLDRLAEDIQSRQGVLCWQAGMLGAALSWLARATDSRRIDAVLAPLAAALSPAAAAAAAAAADGALDAAASASGASIPQAQQLARLLRALRPALDAAPAGSPNLALLRVHRLLHAEEDGEAQASASGGAAGSGKALGEAVAELRRLKPALRDACLPMACAAVAALPPGQLGEPDTLQLLAWLQGAEARLLPLAATAPAGAASLAQAQAARQLQQAVAVARLALCRSLAASQMGGAAALEE